MFDNTYQILMNIAIFNTIITRHFSQCTQK